MDPLTLLKTLLADVNAQSPVALKKCTEIDDVKAALEKQLSDDGIGRVPLDRQLEAVKTFWNTGEFGSFREARFVSFGLGLRPWGDERCIIEEPKQFDRALKGLEYWEKSPRQFRKCYRGLVHSYFEYDGMGRDVSSNGQKNWSKLRNYLNQKCELIKDNELNPEWIEIALLNRTIFSKNPCAVYADDLLDGKRERVNKVRSELGISDASWFTRELVLSQVERACKFDDPEFAEIVDNLLGLIGDNEILRDRGLQLLLDRYARLIQVRPNIRLRDYAVKAWGNPWLPSNEHRWDGVSDDARRMVGDWLKHEFIELFFTKLSQDGSSDRRRLDFWSKYVPLIDEIHFALGSQKYYSRERDMVELKTKLRGLIVELLDGSNNAFIMRMGDLVAVEFSLQSNAFYGYSVKKNLPFSLSRPVRSAPVNGPNSLKNEVRVLYLRHQDNMVGYVDWEDRFEIELRRAFGLDPSKKSDKYRSFSLDTIGRQKEASSTQFKVASRNLSENLGTSTKSSSGPGPTAGFMRFCDENLIEISKRFNAKIEDHRDKGGALWLRMGDVAEVRRLLTFWGFTYTEGKGWWTKKDK